MSDKIKYLFKDAPELGFGEVRCPEPEHYDDGRGGYCPFVATLVMKDGSKKKLKVGDTLRFYAKQDKEET